MKTYGNFGEMFNAQSGIKSDMSVFNADRLLFSGSLKMPDDIFAMGISGEDLLYEADDFVLQGAYILLAALNKFNDNKEWQRKMGQIYNKLIEACNSLVNLEDMIEGHPDAEDN